MTVITLNSREYTIKGMIARGGQGIVLEAVQIGDYIIRQVLMGYDHTAGMGAAHTTNGNSSELRTQNGAIICFGDEQKGEIYSFGKTSDDKLSVRYRNGYTEVIDVFEKMKTPLYWQGKEGARWNLSRNN